LAALDYPEFEIIVASEGEEPEVRRALAALPPEGRARVSWLVDSAAPTFNPKVNVLIPAYRAARHGVILMTDDNAVTPPGRLRELLALLHGRTGLVSAAIVGVAPEGLAAELDAAFMNTFTAKYFMAADRLGFAYAIGKTLLFRRADLDRQGGVASLADGMAEDSVLREKIAAAGLGTVLAAAPTVQRLGVRPFAEVWRRHLRWMAHRRSHAPLPFVGELLQGYFLPWAVVGAFGAAGLGAAPLAGVAATWLAWFAVDLAGTRAAGWHATWRQPLVWTLRELLLPAMWLTVLFKRRIRWRQRDVLLHPTTLARREGESAAEKG
ncbi:MAG: glycosyltransferase, partial [Rhodospirillaceae bacterium]|nr:glycosyltransferase [Rhodospirillaceae bacterium]